MSPTFPKLAGQRKEYLVDQLTDFKSHARSDPNAQRYTVYTSAGGGVIRQRDDIAGALGVAKDAVRVISGDVGGNFGIRNSTCPEFVLVAWAAKHTGRPVKWVCDRRDAFLTDFHGRDLAS